MDETESLNRAIQEEVALFPYDAAWPTLFKQERDRLLDLFPDEFLAIELIDILAGVDSISRADDLLEPLCRAKYATSLAYNASLVGRRWLMRWAEGRRTHHLHLMVYGSEEWHRRLDFRNRLRADTELAQRYEKKKRLWAAEFTSDREAYTAAKGDFIKQALKNAS